jgi:hypothetical protein
MVKPLGANTQIGSRLDKREEWIGLNGFVDFRYLCAACLARHGDQQLHGGFVLGRLTEHWLSL